MITPVQKNREDRADADMIEGGSAGRKAIEFGK